MLRKALAVFFFLFTTLFLQLHAQCIDSTLISNAYCDQHYDPVCACNGKTYKNDCLARDSGVVLSNAYYGICDPVDFDFNPNPPYDHIDVDAILKYQGDMFVQIFDRFGNKFYEVTYPNVVRQQFQIDVRGLPAGVYYLNIYCANGNKVKKVLLLGVT